MAEILVKVTSWLSLLPRISVGNILEIVIISFLVYELLVWIKNTRAWNLLKGLLVILVFVLFAAVLHLTTILWILENTTTIAVTALLVIFQPELRKALEQLGSRNYMSYLFSFDEGKDNQGFNDKTINELVRATFEMAKVKTGALMVIERGSSLKEIERTGIEINGLVTSQLLINIFEHNTPLHDGAVVIRGNRFTAATCYLPLSDNMTISKDLGTRHREAVGVRIHGQYYHRGVGGNRKGIGSRRRSAVQDTRCRKPQKGTFQCERGDCFVEPIENMEGKAEEWKKSCLTILGLKYFLSSWHFLFGWQW